MFDPPDTVCVLYSDMTAAKKGLSFFMVGQQRGLTPILGTGQSCGQCDEAEI